MAQKLDQCARNRIGQAKGTRGLEDETRRWNSVPGFSPLKEGRPQNEVAGISSFSSPVSAVY